MSDAPRLDRNNTALLLMDMQEEVVALLPPPARERLLANAAGLLAMARKKQIPVVYVTVQFAPGYPEISPRNKAFNVLKQAGRLKQGTPGVQVAARLAPAAGEPVVVKYRTGAFANSILETLLRAKDVTHLVLAGFATSGVVLSTVRWAADMDYRLTLVEDACADADEEVHRMLVEKLFPRHAEVVSTAALVAAQG
jgi:nicotinamidase-related amidase